MVWDDKQMFVEVKGGNCFCSNLDWITSCTLTFCKFCFKWTEREEEETGYVPEHLLILPLTQHCIYYSIIPPIFCPLILSPPKNTKAREKKIPQMTNIAKQALKQPSGTDKFRCFRHVLNALKKAVLLFGQLTGLQGYLMYFWSFQKPIFKFPVAVWSQHQV